MNLNNEVIGNSPDNPSSPLMDEVFGMRGMAIEDAALKLPELIGKIFQSEESLPVGFTESDIDGLLSAIGNEEKMRSFFSGFETKVRSLMPDYSASAAKSSTDDQINLYDAGFSKTQDSLKGSDSAKKLRVNQSSFHRKILIVLGTLGLLHTVNPGNLHGNALSSPYNIVEKLSSFSDLNVGKMREIIDGMVEKLQSKNILGQTKSKEERVAEEIVEKYDEYNSNTPSSDPDKEMSLPKLPGLPNIPFNEFFERMSNKISKFAEDFEKKKKQTIGGGKLISLVTEPLIGLDSSDLFNLASLLALITLHTGSTLAVGKWLSGDDKKIEQRYEAILGEIITVMSYACGVDPALWMASGAYSSQALLASYGAKVPLTNISFGAEEPGVGTKLKRALVWLFIASMVYRATN